MLNDVESAIEGGSALLQTWVCILVIEYSHIKLFLGDMLSASLREHSSLEFCEVISALQLYTLLKNFVEC